MDLLCGTSGVMGRQRLSAWMCILAALGLYCPTPGNAGGSGLNVLVVANQASSNSVELANYYRLRRQVPPEHVLRIFWPGGNIEWTQQEFTNTLLNPILAFIASSDLSNQVRFIALSMDIPFRVTGSRANSTTSALFYGFRTGTKNLQNTYAGSEARFSEAPPANAPGYAFLTTMITANSLAQAKALVDQGTDSDGTRTSQPAWLHKSDDVVRNRRHLAFDNAIFNARLCTGYHLARTNNGTLPSPDQPVLGWQTGLANFSLSPNTFVPGSIADSMTSFGGVIFGPNSQTSLLEFIQAGASGSYGTVVEPQTVLDKFPDPLVYYYQSRGFSLAECYYQSLRLPLEGLLVGEPLAAPFRQSCTGGWTDVSPGSTLQGTTNLSLAFTADSPRQRIGRVDLFLNGRWHQTLTNLPPAPGNLLTVSINGYPVTYEVPTNATLGSVASNLALRFNEPATSNITHVLAEAYGDRIQLQSLALLLPGGAFEFVDAASAGGTQRQYLAVLQPDSIPTAITGLRPNASGTIDLDIMENLGVGYLLEASTNLQNWLPIHTNISGGPMVFHDDQAAVHPHRYYRLSWTAPPPPPTLEAMAANAGLGFAGGVNAAAEQPYIVQASSDLHVWSDIFTNLVGGSSVFVDAQATLFPARYYRSRSGDPGDYSQVSVVGVTPQECNIVRVQDNRLGSTVVWASSNGTDWSTIYTRASAGSEIQLSATQAQGSADRLTTSLESPNPVFLDTTAQARRKFSFSGSVGTGSHLALSVQLTNGNPVTVAVTNASGLTNILDLVQLLAEAINTTPELQTDDGMAAEDLIPGVFGSAEFNLRARQPGLGPAGIQVTLSGSPEMVITPAGQQPLNENLSDLSPRNHLFVRSGLQSVALSVPLDTTLLPDGHHEMTAVAYEGTHVHSQTLKSLPVIVANSPLQATLALAAPEATMPVTNAFALVVTANTNGLSEILLFTTGGFHAGATNQPAASFLVNGPGLGVGEHPFYALVTTTSGLRYRTPKVTVTLTP